jgi:hypothetical protein
LNLYGFCGNTPFSKIDAYGLWGRTVHFGATLTWAGQAHFINGFDTTIATADQGVDDNTMTTGVVGALDRHMNLPSKHGMDSRTYWYNTERGNALTALMASDTDHNVSHCTDAAQAFGRGLHSQQDISAHRNWPFGGDWPTHWPGGGLNITLAVHPKWWDDWNGQLNSGDANAAQEQKWADYFSSHPGNDDYNVWTGSASQVASQNNARQAVQSASTQALSWFANEVKKHCTCARMVGN